MFPPMFEQMPRIWQFVWLAAKGAQRKQSYSFACEHRSTGRSPEQDFVCPFCSAEHLVAFDPYEKVI